MKRSPGYTLIELILTTLFMGLVLTAVSTTAVNMLRFNNQSTQMLQKVDRMEQIRTTLKRLMDEAGSGSTIVFNPSNFGKEFTVTGEDGVDFKISINDQHELQHERESVIRTVSAAVDCTLSYFVFRDRNYNSLTKSDGNTEINYVELVGGFTPEGGGGRTAFRSMLTPTSYLMKGFVPSGSSSLPMDIDSEWNPSGNRNDGNFGKPNNPEYSFSLSESKSVEINLKCTPGNNCSGNPDTYMFLLNEDGSQLTYNDDGGSGLNSRITRTLDPGTYYIVAATYSSGRTGTFNLTAEAN